MYRQSHIDTTGYPALKKVTITNWINPDLQSLAGYASSYILRDTERELYAVDLLKQKGFYQISEFTSPDETPHFIIEQTNRTGTPKIAVFDKETGNMLGAFKTNRFINHEDRVLFEVVPLDKLRDDALLHDFTATGDDFAAVPFNHEQQSPILHGARPKALFLRLPRSTRTKHGIFKKIRSMTAQLTKTPREVLELVILDDDICDPRMLYAIAVIIHSRGGLQLNRATGYHLNKEHS